MCARAVSRFAHGFAWRLRRGRGAGSGRRRAGPACSTPRSSSSAPEGLPATTVRAVCARARLTPRYFYESFADRESLVVTLFDELAARGGRGRARRAARRRCRRAGEGPGGDRRRSSRSSRPIRAAPGCCSSRRWAASRWCSGASRRCACSPRWWPARPGTSTGCPGRTDPAVELGSLMLVGGLAETLLAWLDGSAGDRSRPARRRISSSCSCPPGRRRCGSSAPAADRRALTCCGAPCPA